MYCKHCGKKLPDDSAFCPYCGTKQDQGPIQNDQQNNSVKIKETPAEHRRFILRNIIFTILIVATISVALIFFLTHYGDPPVESSGVAQSSGNALMVCPEESYKNNGSKNEFVLGNKDYLATSVVSITFLDTLKNMPNDAWDVSEDQNTSVMVWVIPAENDGCYDMYIAGEGGVDANQDSSYLFAGYSSLTSIDFSDCFYTGNATDMSWLLYGCTALQDLDVGNWDMSHVTNMCGIFAGCKRLNFADVSNWDTSHTTNMMSLFNGCTSLLNLDVGKWDTSEVTNMSFLFSGCNALRNLDVSHWDTSQVTDMSCMFYGCETLQSLGVSSWDTSKLTHMSYLFNDCKSLQSLDLSRWDTSQVTMMNYVFYDCQALQRLDISNWDTSQVAEMKAMFYGCSSLESLDVSSLDMSNADTSDMFFGTKWE